MTNRRPNLDEANNLLDLLEPDGQFTFQTFDDSEHHRGALAHVVHGSLNDAAFQLERLNSQGAGVFVTVNRTDLKGRQTSNITSVRAVFVDLDGSPLEPVRECELVPHVIVESSPNRWHAYWQVEDCPLDAFKPIQKGLAHHFNGDRKVNDLPRVMRLPGFWHQKGDPFQSKVIEWNALPPYPLQAVLDAFGWATPADAEPAVSPAKPDDQAPRAYAPGSDDDKVEDLRDALRSIRVSDDDREIWVSVGMALKTFGDRALPLFMEWSSQSKHYNPTGAVKAWESFKPEGRTSYQSVFVIAKQHGWDPRNSPSHQRRRAQREEKPRPPTGEVAETAATQAPPAPQGPVTFDNSAEALVRRYELIYGTRNVWDVEFGTAMPFAAFAAMFSKTAANAWLDDAKRRTRMPLPETPKKPKDEEPTDFGGPLKVEWMLPRYALIYGDEAVFDREQRRELTLGALRAFVGLKAVRDWGDHPERSVVNEDQVLFDPRRQLNDPSVCNLWGGWPLQPAAGSATDQDTVQRWLSVLHYACGDSDAIFDWVLKWIAYPLQNTGTKMRTSIIMHGTEGSGKNTVWDAVRRIYGRYGMQITQTQLEQQWCDWLSARMFIVGNEVLQRQEQIQQKGRLKTIVSDATIRIERKFMNGRTEYNFANLVFLSNELQPLNIDPEDRRFLVIWTPVAHPDGPAFYKGLGEPANGQDGMPESAVQAIYRYMLDLDLGDFGPHTKPPMTQAKKDLIDASMESGQRFVRDWLAGDLEIPCRPCKTQDLYNAYLYWCRLKGERFPKPENKFAARAKKEMPWGVKRYASSVTGVTKQATFYLPPGATPPPDKKDDAWLGSEAEAFQKAYREWRDQQL